MENENFDLFLKSRRSDKTKDYTRRILECLSIQYDEDVFQKEKGRADGCPGWVRPKELYKRVKIIPNESTYYKLLGDMEKAKLIERISGNGPGLTVGPGKTPVYYRVPGVYRKKLLKLMSKEDLEKALIELDHECKMVARQLMAAKLLLDNYNKNNPEYNVENAILTEVKIRFPDFNDQNRN